MPTTTHILFPSLSLLLLVRLPLVNQPYTERGCLLPLLLPRPPPCGWSQAFMATPRTVGRRPSQRLRPALPRDVEWCSLLVHQYLTTSEMYIVPPGTPRRVSAVTNT
jgi:hypothetical protein